MGAIWAHSSLYYMCVHLACAHTTKQKSHWTHCKVLGYVAFVARERERVHSEDSTWIKVGDVRAHCVQGGQQQQKRERNEMKSKFKSHIN